MSAFKFYYRIQSNDLEKIKSKIRIKRQKRIKKKKIKKYYRNESESMMSCRTGKRKSFSGLKFLKENLFFVTKRQKMKIKFSTKLQNGVEEYKTESRFTRFFSRELFRPPACKTFSTDFVPIELPFLFLEMPREKRNWVFHTQNQINVTKSNI